MFTVQRPLQSPVQTLGLLVHFPDGVLDLQLQSGRLACLSRSLASEPEVLCSIALRNGGANDLRLGLALFGQYHRVVPGLGELRLQSEGLDTSPQPWGAAKVSARIGDVPVEVLADHERAELGLFIRLDPTTVLGSDAISFLVHPCGANCFSIGVQ